MDIELIGSGRTGPRPAPRRDSATHSGSRRRLRNILAVSRILSLLALMTVTGAILAAIVVDSLAMPTTSAPSGGTAVPLVVNGAGAPPLSRCAMTAVQPGRDIQRVNTIDGTTLWYGIADSAPTC